MAVMQMQSVSPMLRRGRLGLLSMMLLAVVFTAGCEGVAFLAGMGGERVPAQYKIPDRPTLVMVEDPDNALGDPRLSRLIASHVGFHLEENRAVRRGVVSQSDLAELAERLDEDYRRMPIDRIGQQLGADQVIHVLIDEVDLVFEPGVYRPTAYAEVKVIDAAESRRLFPLARRMDADGGPAPGLRIQSQLSHRVSGEADTSLEAMLLQALAEQMGREIAQVFYDHQRLEGGSQLP
ncbi:hypothetical protein ACERK3_12210 [Phycisphaerales bacterium AB-hyl4]|uniref:Lipoprotein n=1 Tax=Natronomicrosphaera hydrolytica TaxID=3242702 RepID=A0ABV4U6V9_9BACT